jgi:hypothetical protein
MKAVRNIGHDGQTEAVIRFNMKQDEEIRKTARNGYEISKNLHSLGLKFKRIIPASTDISVQKQFKLPTDSSLICVEIDVRGKSDLDKQLLISDTKGQLSTIDIGSLVSEGEYKYDSSSIVYRFLLKPAGK